MQTSLVHLQINSFVYMSSCIKREGDMADLLGQLKKAPVYSLASPVKRLRKWVM